ncbi:hypothetical protein U9M48_002436, partial [Paspalum notatum var. saurae]
GILPDGALIAVKRLSKHSSQGFHELKNELMLVAKLKHKNLVRLMGACMPASRKVAHLRQLDWCKRFLIIFGIARGLLYLHEESRLKVSHRDLKPSNVLLDADMNPKNL